MPHGNAFTLIRPPPPTSTLFPYTTLFRSRTTMGCRGRSIWHGPANGSRRPGVHFRAAARSRSQEHTSELQSQSNLVCRLLLEKKNNSHPEHLTRHYWDECVNYTFTMDEVL